MTNNANHLPQLTEEQRMENLARAAEARTERAQALREVSRGEMTAEQALADPRLQSCKVFQWLRAFPGIGQGKADAILHELGIAPSRRVRGMGARQRERVLARLADRADGGR